MKRRRVPLGKRIVLSLVTVLVFFAALEGLLALLGVDPDRPEGDPLIGFARIVPHFIRETDETGREVVRTSPAKLRFLNEQTFPATKPPNTVRVFCVGGSTTYGRPFFDDASFAAYLRLYLPAADPAHRYEVVNAGGISYASYRVIVLMEELARYDPDVFVVYTGQNEFLEARTYGGILRTPEILREAMAWASRTRTGTLIRRVLGEKSAEKPNILPTDPKGIPVNAVGPDAYHRDDAFREQVVRHFRRNLAKMADIAREAGARIVFVVPASNLVDFSPFSSEPSPGLAPERRKEFDRRLARGTARRKAGDRGRAVEDLRRAVAIDPRHAEAQYQLGRALLAHNDEAAAMEHFRRARDEDICPMRAISAIIASVREIAADRGAGLVDLPGAIPLDRTSFYDHVHLTPPATRTLSRMLVRPITGRAWERGSAVDSLEPPVDTRKHAGELRKLAGMLHWLEKPVLALRCAREALVLEPGAASEVTLGALLEASDPDAARRHYEKALAENPRSVAAHFSLGRLAEKDGDLPGAEGHYRAATNYAPEGAPGWERLALLLLHRGEGKEAVRCFERVVALTPESATAHSNLGLACFRQGETARAMREYDEALRLDPRHPAAHLNKGILLAAQGRKGTAAEEFRAVLAVEPDHAEAKRRLRELGP